ncbi:hypothetical protein NKH77_04760 [Streptomyces sp. M19]
MRGEQRAERLGIVLVAGDGLGTDHHPGRGVRRRTGSMARTVAGSGSPPEASQAASRRPAGEVSCSAASRASDGISRSSRSRAWSRS